MIYYFCKVMKSSFTQKKVMQNPQRNLYGINSKPHQIWDEKKIYFRPNYMIMTTKYFGNFDN